MKFTELNGLVDQVPERERQGYRECISLIGIGDRPWEKFVPAIEQANTLDDVFEAIYADSEMRFEQVWSAWARLKNKMWLNEFSPVEAYPRMAAVGQGVVFESGEVQLLIPTKRRAMFVDMAVYADGTLNTDLPEFYGTITGKFSINKTEIPEGTYDVYREDIFLLLVRWELDEKGNRPGQEGPDCFKAVRPGGNGRGAAI